ncbi:Histidine protein kinase DivJ [Penicillium rolfsii]|nr:Histidine protein kinase DivJ [Penicillium rolfsii]
MASGILDAKVSFFPKADGIILRSKQLASPVSRPQTIGPIFDGDNLDRPIEPWSSDVKSTFYPHTEANEVSAIPQKPPEFADKYLRAFLAEHERLRLSVLWYYTRDVFSENEFLVGLQEKAHLAQESTGWEFAVIGILDVNVYIRLATVGLELGILPRGETLCAHTVTQPPGDVFLLPSLMEDWRFRQCPYLESGGLYAYAGVPLRLKTESGLTVGLGSLCVASSKSEEPLTKAQHQALVRLADWVVSDLIQCTRARRQRERHRMSELLAEAQKETSQAVALERVFEILKTIYPDAMIRVQPSRATHVEFEGCDPIPVSELRNGLWEDVEYLDDFIANSNHLPTPNNKPIRIIAAPCEMISGSSLLIVATKDFHLVFDDADAWFVQACADLISQMWRKSLFAEAMLAKEKFLRGFSHQLRTPIHGILGSVELLAEELKSRTLSEGTLPMTAIEESTPDSEINSREPFTYLNIIKMAGRDLTSIVNNLIALNKWTDIAMAERHYAKHTLDALETKIVNEVAKVTMGDTRYECSIFLTQILPPGCEKICIDLEVLRDTLLPLVINSIHHTPQGIVSVTMSVHADRKQLVVDVEDTGRGIPPADQKRIFEAYEKGDPHSSGAGLGLTLASKFASLIHGSIELIHSEIDRGSHFRATFREVECDFLPQTPQSLALTLDNLPSRFFKTSAQSGSSSLSDYFASFLTRSGFTRSETIEDCLVILEAGPDMDQHREWLSQIPSGQVAICLVPISEERNYLRETEDNVFYIDGPFLTSTFHSALEKAHDYLRSTSRSPLPLPITREIPILTTVTIQKDPITDGSIAQYSPTTIKNHITTNTTNSPTQPDVSVPVDLRTPSTLDPPLRTSPHPMTLIVDDNAVNLRVMETYCAKRGLPYLSAMNGRQAVEIFTRHQKQATPASSPPSSPETDEIVDPDSAIQLIFMDLQMPVCGGIEATQQIRALEKMNHWRKAFLVVMTGQDSPADRNAAEKAGADDYFVKPVVLKQLDRVVRQYFPAFGSG